MMIKKTAFAILAATTLAVPGFAMQPDAAPGPDNSWTLADVQARITEKFGRTDTDMDGFVTRAEAEASEAQRHARREEWRSRRAERKADGSADAAQPDPAERQAKRERWRSERRAWRSDAPLRLGEERFAQIDSDGDGRLSRAEVTTHAGQHFEQLDTNRDGTVTREERRAARKERQGRRTS